ncbi:MAG: type II toxin-antitoxin system VapC family toxin [Actinobacteria bacterium]|nr:type II toxin-antitoxin system VapC family toxin [Actinomycetota bacterium]
MIVYLETSAAAKLMKREAESGAVRAYLQELIDGEHLVVAGRVMETELRRLAVRQGMPQGLVAGVLEVVDVVEHDRDQFREAGMIGDQHLRSLDALHLVTALRVGADAMITFDERLEQACASVGLPVLAIHAA